MDQVSARSDEGEMGLHVSKQADRQRVKKGTISILDFNLKSRTGFNRESMEILPRVGDCIQPLCVRSTSSI
jgi:hypothetical protein